jgi:hypothetical protein
MYTTNISHYHRFIQTSPEKNFTKYNCKAKLWKIASIISIVAIGVFAAVIFTATNFFTVTNLPLALFLLTFAIPIYGEIHTTLKDWSDNFRKLSKFENKISQELKILKKTSIDVLKKYIHTEHNYKTVLPAIARFLFWEKRYKTQMLKSKQILDSRRCSIPSYIQKIKSALIKQESKAMKAKLLAAHAFWIVQHPTTDIELHDKGKLFILENTSILDRFAYRYFSMNDTYFIFHNSTKNLKIKQIEKMSTEDLAKELFD